MPLTDGYGQNIPYPTLTDKPNAQTLGQGIVDGVTPKLIMSFPSAVNRGATIKKPLAGMVTWIKDIAELQLFDGAAWVTVAAGTSTWKTLPLASGYTHNGNDNGTAQYRVVNLFGEPTLMFRGGLNVAYNAAGGAIANNGTVTSSALPIGARPTTRRTITAACSVYKSDLGSLKVDLNTNGHIVIVGTNTTDVKPPWVSLNGVFCSL
jgi:hypothetical protein